MSRFLYLYLIYSYIYIAKIFNQDITLPLKHVQVLEFLFALFTCIFKNHPEFLFSQFTRLASGANVYVSDLSLLKRTSGTCQDEF